MFRKLQSPTNKNLEYLVELAYTRTNHVLQQQLVFVYRPGEPNPQGVVFNDWNKLYAEFIDAQGPKIIQIDDSVISPAVIPAGIYDLNNTTVIGNLQRLPAGVPVSCRLNDGVQFLNIGEISDAVYITSHNTTTPVHTLTDNDRVLIHRGAGVFSANGTVPFFHVPAGLPQPPLFVMFEGGLVGDVPGNHVVQVDPGASITFILNFVAGLQNDSLTGAGGNATILVGEQNVFLNTPNPILQPSLLGANVLIYCFAELCFFQALNPANWVGPPPTNVTDAINRMATVVAALNAGPIP